MYGGLSPRLAKFQYSRQQVLEIIGAILAGDGEEVLPRETTQRRTLLAPSCFETGVTEISALLLRSPSAVLV